MHHDRDDSDAFAWDSRLSTLAAVEKAADAVLAHYLANAPAADELSRAKTQLVASALYRRDSQFAMATAYGQALGAVKNRYDAIRKGGRP